MTATHSLAALAGALVLASTALAEDPKPAGNANPPAVAQPAAEAKARPAAEELARVVMPKSTWETGMNGLAMSVQARMDSHPGSKLQYPPDFAKKVRAEVDAALPYDALVGIHAKQLGASFNDEELKDLVAFYRSPIGQKALQVMPDVTEKVALETQQRIEAKMPQIMDRLVLLVKAPADAQVPAQGGAAKPKAAAPAAKAAGAVTSK